MSYPELAEITELRDRWVAIAPTGTNIPCVKALRSGLLVVDYDEELDELCARLDEEHRTSLTIVWAGAPGVSA